MPLRWRDDPFETPIAHISDLVPFALDSAVVHKDALVYNAKDHGVKGDGVTDDTAAANTLSSSLATAVGSYGGAVMYFPPGTYILDGLVHRNGVHIRGAGPYSTIFKAKAGGSAAAVILLNSGTVTADIKDVRVLPNGNSGQHGIWFTNNSTNGCWQFSRFDNVHVGDVASTFSGSGIWLQGGGNNFLAPHQMNTFYNVNLYGATANRALTLSGQVGQFQVIGGQILGAGGAQSIVWVYRYLDNTGAPIGPDTTSPYDVHFFGTTFQTSTAEAIFMREGDAHFHGCHFEGLAKGVTATEFAFVYLDDCSFRTTGAASGAGYLGSVDAFSNGVANLTRSLSVPDTAFVNPTRWNTTNSQISGYVDPLTVPGLLTADSDVDIPTIGKGLKVAEGTNAKQGTATLVAGTTIVANTSITANSRIFLTTQSPGGTIGMQYVSARVVGTSFTITSTSPTDTSTVAYEIFEPG